MTACKRERWRLRPVGRSMEAVARAYDISKRRLYKCGDRSRQDAHRRFLVMWLARRLGASWYHIARYMGYDNHTSALHGVRFTGARRRKDPEFRAFSDALLGELKNSVGIALENPTPAAHGATETPAEARISA